MAPVRTRNFFGGLDPFHAATASAQTRFLRWIHWDWAVNLLENYFDRWVMLLRLVLIVVAVVLLHFGWEYLRD